MKIYEKIVIEMSTGKILEEQSFEYKGPIAECKGGSAPPPGPTPQETALTMAQTELIEQQIAQLRKESKLLDEMWPALEEIFAGQIDLQGMQIETAKTLLPLQEELAKQGIDLTTMQIEGIKEEIERNKALEPAILETIGFTKDESGKYIPTTNIQKQLEETYMKALSGETPISPALEAEIGQQEKQLRQHLSQKLGPGYETTTPGIQALDQFQRRATLVREEARRGMTESAAQQYLGYTGLTAGNLMALAGGTPQALSITPGTSTGLLAGTSGGSTGGINIGNLFSGGSASSVSSQIQSLSDQLKAERMEPWMLQQGQKAGRTQTLMSGLIGGASRCCGGWCRWLIGRIFT